MELTPEHFREFFREVYRDTQTGYAPEPFPWQVRLAEQVSSVEGGRGSWPDVLALPTGSGKTTCIDIAVFALAAQAHLPTDQRTAPRRIFLVIDRRVVVDEAYEHARVLAQRLFEAESGILKAVADRLRQVGGTEVPLTCHQLRGGMYRDDAWARTPTQPCVIASTVDQIGSRLLFRSYGRSFRSWPVHAGLAGNDALILLDEAHCANAFRQTLQAVARYRQGDWCEQPLKNPFHVVILSATPPETCGGKLTTVSGDDLKDPVLGKRIGASKPVRLVVARDARGENSLAKLALSLVEQAIDCVSDQHRAIAVLANRVATARHAYRIFELLLSNAEPDGVLPQTALNRLRTRLREQKIDEFDVVLVIGRMRPIDRDRVTQTWLRRLSVQDSAQRRLDRPVFVVATQCIEVGANLDFDAMVTECASLDALRQRFGRLNRSGRPIQAKGVVVIRADQQSSNSPDPIYGEALKNTWQQLERWGQNGQVDFGVVAMDRLWRSLSPEERERLLYQAPEAPVLLPAHLDLLVQTSPPPHSSPDVAIFLHGPQRSVPEVHVCWRADLPDPEQWAVPGERGEEAATFEANVVEAVSLCPPTQMECLPVPLPIFARWWSERRRQREAELDPLLADVENMAVPPTRERREAPPCGLIWRGPRESVLLRQTGQLRPGDTIVLPVGVEGWDVLGYIPDASPERIDVSQLCQWQVRRRAVLRLHLRPTAPGVAPVLEPFGEPPEQEPAALTELKELLVAYGGDPDALPNRDELVEKLKELIEQPDADWIPAWLREAINQGLQRTLRPELIPHPFGGIVLRSRRPLPRPLDRITYPEVISLDDDTASATGRVTLYDHSRSVASYAREFGKLTHLPDRLVRTLELAAWLHDLGKADIRYQAFLCGGSRLVAQLAADVYAKSIGLRDDARGFREAWKLADLPDEFRHELVSLQILEHCRPRISPLLADQEADLDDHQPVDWDLVRHLIGMHHGYARPFAPVVDDAAADPEDLPLKIRWCEVDVQADERRRWPPPGRIDSGMLERFWRLVRRYGWWGLAWLEAIFVLADHRVSEKEATEASRAGTAQGLQVSAGGRSS